MTKTLTAQIRAILREYGCAKPYEMWTNKYARCRTVKCYAPADEELIIDAAEQIQDLCEAEGIVFNMKVRRNSSAWGRRSAIIVRLPLYE